MTERLYNNEVKQAYINSYFGEENTKNNILFAFAKSSEVEKQYNKDIYAFNDSEIASLLLYLKRDNINSLNRDLSIYKEYVNWCILNGKRGEYENGENRMEIFQMTEDMGKYVSSRKVKGKFLTKGELNDLIGYLNNPLDQAFILSIYEFIGGEQLHELRSLTIKDVDDENNKIMLTDSDGSTRIASISTKLVELLKETNDTKTYLMNNGYAKRRSEVELTDSPYIFRMANRKSQIGEMANYGSMINKMGLIKKYTGYDLITVNSIKETRIIHEIADVAKQMELKKANNDTYRTAFDNLSKQYNVSFSNTQEHNLKRKYEQAVKLKAFT